MTDKELLQCPLLQGLDGMRRAELLGVMNSSNLRTKLEECLAGKRHATAGVKEPASTNGCEQDFEKQVHSWNPEVPLWRRSNKE